MYYIKLYLLLKLQEVQIERVLLLHVFISRKINKWHGQQMKLLQYFQLQDRNDAKGCKNFRTMQLNKVDINRIHNTNTTMDDLLIGFVVIYNYLKRYY